MHVWVIIYAIGAAQAALLASVLWRRPVNATANRLLAAWLAIVAADLGVKVLYLAVPEPAFLKAARFVALFPFLYASLFYIYVRALTTGRGLRRRDAVHLVGFVLGLLAVAPNLIGRSPVNGPPPWWYDPLLFAWGLGYVAAAIVRVQRYRRLIRQRRSDADRLLLRWIDAMAVAQAVIWCIAAMHALVQIPGVDYFLIYGAVAAWICVVGYFSLAQPPAAYVPAEEPDAAANPAADDPRLADVEARLGQLMANESLFREPALTIGQLARRSGYPEYLVSAAINRRLGGNFWEYINRQRVEATRVCLADPTETRTILDIAYACGFTSKSTFNTAFKRELGQTPSHYRRQQAASAAISPPA